MDGFSNGHLDSNPNRKLVFKEKQNNMGIYIGKISKYNKNKGHITCKLENSVSIGDGISFENENTKFTISELMKKNNNLKTASQGEEITFGRMKGNISVGDKIFKITDKNLSDLAHLSYSKETIKTPLNCKLVIKNNRPIYIKIDSPVFKTDIEYTSNILPQTSQNSPIDKEKIIKQFNKTLDTPFSFESFDIELDDNLFIPVSGLNEIRRTALNLLENKILSNHKNNSNLNYSMNYNQRQETISKNSPKISLLLNLLNLDYNYTSLENVDKLYIPLKYFSDKKYYDLLLALSNKFNLYIYMPTILRKNYIKVAQNIIEKALEQFKIKGFVISNISQLNIIPLTSDLEFIGNYTLNIYNNNSSKILSDLKIETVTISPELDENAILDILKANQIPKELIVYGNTPVMTMNYCPLGKSNHCYKECSKKCMENKKYYLKDRMDFKFRILPDNSQTITTIYNSKITSIEPSNFNINFARIDILDETILEINNIIQTVKLGNRLEGKDYTNGNLKRDI